MNIPIVSQLAQLIGGAVTDFLTIRRIKAEGRINLERARQDAELKRVTSMEDYDTLAVQGMEHSWKDEFLVLVFTFILVANFLPGVQDYVIVGWGYLEKAPEWFTYSYMGMVAASFGTRWLMQRKLFGNSSLTAVSRAGTYVKTFKSKHSKGDDR